MQDLYSFSFNDKAEVAEETSEVIAKLKKIDGLIVKAAPAWPLPKINKIDLAVLRLATFELLFETGIPPKVVIDEAVEIGKEYGSESSGSFINGVLGKLVSLQEINV